MLGRRIRNFFRGFGPGITTGAADDDPSGIVTYSQAGTIFGTKLLFLAPITFPLMALVQEACARIALATGRGLASNIKIHFSRKILVFVVILVSIANIFNIGADIGAMGEVINMLFPFIPWWLPIIFIASISVFFEIVVPYEKYARYLKWLAFSLFSYIIVGFSIHLDLTELAKATFSFSIPDSKSEWIMIAAILGTTISPYLFFWQTSQEVEDEIGKGNNSILKRKIDGPFNISQMKKDVWFGMFFSNVVMFFIIVVCAKVINAQGIHTINSAKDAALALRPVAGDFSFILYSIGILGTGLLAIPVLAGSTGYVISETFGKREGLYLKFRQAKFFYKIITLSVAVGMLINFIGITPTKALIYSSVLNALIAPIILFCIIKLVSKSEIMGGMMVGRVRKYILIATLLIMVAVSLLVVIPF